MSSASAAILIPVFNGAAEVRRCVASVLAHTPPEIPVWLLDDASTDPGLLDWLDRSERAEPRLQVLRADVNLGFVGNVNRGLTLTAGDVIVLNSDTIVTAGWAEKLLRCARRHPEAGLICPFSNNATILSIPRMNADNPVPEGLDLDGWAALVARCAQPSAPPLPVAVGFCMLIRRAVIDRLGPLHRAYRRGYGEECDYSLRARAAGFTIRCCDDAFVYHEGERSFGAVSGLADLRRHNAGVLLARWPFYDALIARFCALNPLREAQERIHAALARARGDSRPALLQVLHAYDTLGGTELHSRAVIAGVAADWRVTVLFPGRCEHAWQDLRQRDTPDGGRILEYDRARIAGAPMLFGESAALADPLVEATFGQLVAGGGYAIVHFQHLLGWGSFALPEIARSNGAAVVLSLHDYHLCCPIYDLLLPSGGRCGRDAASADDPGCLECLAAYRGAGDPSFDPAAYLRERTRAVRSALAAATVIVAPSRYVRDRFARIHGPAIAARIQVIPHGVTHFRKLPAPRGAARLRVGIFANLNRRKGAELLLETLDRLAGTVELTLGQFGGVDERYAAPLDQRRVHRHGVYQLADLPRLAADIELALVPSIYEETFCLTIAELQALGIPAIALAVGAIPERIQDGENGFLVLEETAAALAERIRAIAADRPGLARLRQSLRRLPVKRLEDNQRDYARLYAQLLARPPLATPEDATARADRLMAEVLALAEPVWRAGPDGYGSARNRQWLAHWSDPLLPPPAGASDTAAPAIDLAVIVQAADPDGADLDRTLASLRRAWRPGARILVFSPAPVSSPAADSDGPARPIRWYPLPPEAQCARLVNRQLLQEGGDWIGWIQPGDVLHPETIDLVRGYLAAHPAWRFIYTDEDRIAEDGRRYRPRFKPDLNLDLLRSTPYIGDLWLIERMLLLQSGGLEPNLVDPGHALALRVLDACGEAAIGHLPRVLYHRTDTRPAPAATVPRQAALTNRVARHLERARIAGQVQATGFDGVCWVDYPAPDDPAVALIVATAGDLDAVRALLEQLLAVFEHPEILILDAQPRAHSGNRLTIAGRTDVRYLRGLPGGGLAAALNQALRMVRAEFVLFGHDGIRLRPGHGLTFLTGLTARADIGLAGPCILDAQGRIRQGAPIAGCWPLGALGQLHRGQTLTERGALDRNVAPQNVVTVSDQAFMLRRALFWSLGGFRSQDYPQAWYLLDYGLRLAARNLKTVWTPHAALLDTGQGSFARYRRTLLRGPAVAIEAARLYDDWLPQLAADPAYNPNLSLRAPGQPEVAVAPRWDAVVETRPRCLGVPDGRWASAHYRVIDPLEALHRAGLARCTVLADSREDPVPNAVELARLAPQTVLLHNALHDRHLHAVALYRRYSPAGLIFSLDDRITALPDWNPFARTNYPDLEARLRQQLAACDRLLVSTPALADAYGSLAPDCRVVPNRLSAARWAFGAAAGAAAPDPDGPARRPRIGWAGANQHEGDLVWLAPVVESLARDADWYFFGMCPEALRPAVRFVLPMVDFGRYPSTLAGLELDVAIAPLALNDFNRCKSNLKLLEYGALGIPVVCTDLEPYRGGAPVERLANDPRRWREALRARIHDRALARREGARLREWVRAGWMLEDHLDDWRSALHFNQPRMTGDSS